AALAIELLPGIVEESEPEIGERPRDGLSVEDEVLLGQVPPARADEERRDLVVELVGLPLRRGEGELLADRVHEIDVAHPTVAPGGGERVLEIRHEDVSAGIERVDHHLALDRPGDLDEPLLEVLGTARDLEVGVAYLLGFRKEIELLASVQLHLAGRPLGEKLFPPRVQFAMEPFDEGERFLGEDLARRRDAGTPDFDAHEASVRGNGDTYPIWGLAGTGKRLFARDRTRRRSAAVRMLGGGVEHVLFHL